MKKDVFRTKKSMKIAPNFTEIACHRHASPAIGAIGRELAGGGASGGVNFDPPEGPPGGPRGAPGAPGGPPRGGNSSLKQLWGGGVDFGHLCGHSY